jgi:hypothetical protein
MSPGESEVAEAHCPASPPPPPRRGPLSWGMPPAVRMVEPEDPRAQTPPILKGGLGRYGLFPPSPATIVLRPLGRRPIK